MLKGTKGLFIMLGGAIIFILILGLIVQANQGKKNVLSNFLPTSTAAPTLKEITIGKVGVMVQIADTDATRARGLGGVTNLPADQGMLFVFSSKGIRPSFWMKDMQIPLDFIWISNGQVAQIDTNIPAPAAGTPDSQLKVYSPGQPIDFVLEVNSGFAIKNNIKVGDQVSNLQ